MSRRHAKRWEIGHRNEGRFMAGSKRAYDDMGPICVTQSAGIGQCRDICSGAYVQAHR